MHLVARGADVEASFDPFSPAVRRRRAPGRPGDVPESWHLTADAPLRRLAAQAVEVPLHLDTALGLVVERELLRRELSVAGLAAGALSAVDVAAAEQASVRLALPGADAVYLRSLTRGADIDRERLVIPRAGSDVCLALPARLSARLLAAGGPQQLACRPDLASAIRVEVAAVCAGQTMSEWAAWALARALAAGGQPAGGREV